VLALPVGIYLGFLTTSLPFLLKKEGSSVEQVATVGAVLRLPALLFFLWAPLVDSGLRRRSWLVLAAAVAGIGLWAGFPRDDAALTQTMIPLLLLTGIAVSIIHVAGGGLIITSLTRFDQAKASAWYEAGKFASAGISAAAILSMTMHLPPALVAGLSGLLLSLPSLVAYAVTELPPQNASRFLDLFKDAKNALTVMLHAPERRWNLALLAGPGGSGAAQALLPVIASRYNVDISGIVWINGILGSLLMAGGALSGRLLPGYWDRRITYGCAGLLNGLSLLILLTGKAPVVYLIGTVLYLTTVGLCWSRYFALLFDTIVPTVNGISASYSILAIIGNVPVVVMLWLDGASFAGFGVPGLVMTDALGSIIMVVFSIWLHGRTRSIQVK
jgi:hypothetical protein